MVHCHAPYTNAMVHAYFGLDGDGDASARMVKQPDSLHCIASTSGREASLVEIHQPFT